MTGSSSKDTVSTSFTENHDGRAENNSSSCMTITTTTSTPLDASTYVTSPSSSTTTTTSGKPTILLSSTAGRDIIAGALSGGFARTVTAPIERVKLILQLQNSITPTTTKSTTSSLNRPTTTTTTAWDVTKTIFYEEGIWAFWRGNFQNVIRAAGQSALNFALMDYYKRLAYQVVVVAPPNRTSMSTANSISSLSSSRPNWIVSFVSGGLAGGTATTVLYPTEFVRTRLALDHGGSTSEPGKQPRQQQRQYRGMVDAITKIVKVDGIRGIYQGYGISLFGSIIYRLLYLGGYDVCKTEWIEWEKQQQQQQQEINGDRHNTRTSDNSTGENSKTLSSSISSSTSSLSWTELFWLAQFVSLTAGTICYPIDSVRRRMMMQAGRPQHQRPYTNSFQCCSTIWRTEGIRGFYLGIGPNLIRSFSGAVALVAYDGFKTILT